MKGIVLFLTIFLFVTGYGQSSYFQQTVNTTIDVKLDDKKHFLHGSEIIEYINNSPNVLDSLVIHIWPNAYKNNNSALATQLDENGEVDFHFADAIDRGYIDSLSFMIDGKNIVYNNYLGEEDIIVLKLPNSLKPGGSVVINTPFRVKIPKGIYSRLGHIGESYQITQWFPKPAVYDEEGWHPITYLSQGEFFSEYGSYDVKITVPKNYVVGATGDMVNGEKEMAFLNEIVSKTEKMVENNTFPINKAGYGDMSFPKSSTEMKTLEFHQENVHDFAWFADKRYNVLKGEVELPVSKRKVTTWAMFTNNEADLWTKSIEYLNDATYYYSLWTGEYPYNHVTAVDGSISAGGGMEYPNITVIGESYTPLGLEQVIVHEVGHNWFYGILGSNERYNAWMDEGLNTYTENRYTENKYPETGMDFGIPEKIMDKVGLGDMGARGMYDIGYVFNARRNYDQPIQTRSDLFTPMNYGAIVYGKTGIGFDYLLAYLGNETFGQCMHAYFEKWKFKHPKPEDLQKVFEEVSGENLTWLFDDYIKTNKKIDYKISKVKKEGDSIYVTLKNKELLQSPVLVSFSNQGAITDEKWVHGFEKKTTIAFKNQEYSDVVLDRTNDMPTIDRTDDQYSAKGLFKKSDPIKFKLLGSYENQNESHVYYSPVVGWNAQDKVMLGLALYNKSFPERKLEWIAMPMYAFGSKRLTGFGEIEYNHNHKVGPFRKTSIGAQFKSYSTEGSDYVTFYNDQNYQTPTLVDYFKPWMKSQIKIETELNNHNLRKSKHSIVLRGINIQENISIYNTDITNAINFKYKVQNKQILKPASIEFNVVSLSSLNYGTFTGASIEGKFRKNYNVDLRGFEVRFFAAQTLDRNEALVTSKYNWSLTGQRGAGDYLFDNTLLGRYQQYPNMVQQQSIGNQGAFKTNTIFDIGSSNSWVVAANFKIEAPIKFPIGIFSDLGMHPAISSGDPIVKVQYDAGIYIPIRKDIFEIYIPIFYSEDIKGHLDYYDVSFLQTIRFNLNLNAVNPFKLIKDIKP